MNKKTICDICDKKFNNSKSVANHKRWHNLLKYKSFHDKFGVGRPPINPKQIKSLIPEKAYILGVLCGDGYIVDSTRTIGLEVKDKDFVLYFNDCIKKTYGINSKIRYYKGMWGCFIISKQIIDDLKKYCNTFKSREWSTPKQIITYKNDNKKTNLKAFFLKGLFDSEGYISKKQAMIEFTLINYKALLEVKRLLNDLHINSKISKKNSGFVKCYRLRITGLNNINIFYEKIGFAIKRKQKILSLHMKLNIIKRKLYQQAWSLFDSGLGTLRISKELGVKRGLIDGWIYENRVPFIIRGDIYE